MDPTETPDGWTWVDNSHNAQNGDQTVTNSVLNNTTTTEGPDKWTGFLQQLVGAGFAYAVKKDSVTSGVTPKVSAYTATGQPLYMPAQQQAAPINMNLLLVGALVVGGLFALKKG